MDPVTVPSKFQVVTPQQVRKSLRLVPGIKMQVVQYKGRIEFIPVRLAKKLRGAGFPRSSRPVLALAKIAKGNSLCLPR